MGFGNTSSYISKAPAFPDCCQWCKVQLQQQQPKSHTRNASTFAFVSHISGHTQGLHRALKVSVPRITWHPYRSTRIQCRAYIVILGAHSVTPTLLTTTFVETVVIHSEHIFPIACACLVEKRVDDISNLR
jgi:hypothetical protein